MKTIAFRCQGCDRMVRIPTISLPMFWLAYLRWRWHRLWCREEMPR